ncbi:hypothetical protein CDAR_27521 [Caerostris darwini]|uniref:Uncharacterized protein n=1 Tax=Caerostris darwini TaxID=1538125 RepID=A0AAV4VV41_9ARAC|nr:hypothetical protein CDAR_27521 [Caerostris darwini]
MQCGHPRRREGIPSLESFKRKRSGCQPRVFNRHFTTPGLSSESSPTLCDSGDKTSPSERVFLASLFFQLSFSQKVAKNGLVYYMKLRENVKVHT